MPRRQEFQENHYYHVYNRWLAKQTLFFDNRDFQRFLLYISEQKDLYKDDIWLVAYCIIPNHFHFVIKNKKAWLSISQFIWKICASYAKYVWAKYGMQWEWKSLFESRFKAKLISDEDYLSQCVQYVEYNALKHKLVDKPEDWIFRSDSGYKLWNEILNLDWEFDF